MSYTDGWKALNLEMPGRVPRTEYSAAEMHFDLIRAVTGIPVDISSPDAVKHEARVAFMRAWNFDLCWSTLIGGEVFGDLRTSMGHAVYAAGGTDFRPDAHSAFEGPEAALAFDPWEALGPQDKEALRRRFDDHYRANRAAFPDAVNMTGIYVTGISGLLELFGWEHLLLALGMDATGMGATLARYASWIQQYFDALAESEAPVVMVHDDIVWTSGPFYDPAWYRAHLFPCYRRYFAPLLARGKKILYTSDGDYTLFIDDIVDCGVHGLVLEPMTDMGYIAERYGDRIAFIGNADTRVLLDGDPAAIRAEVERCMAIGKRCPGFIMAVGNHIPPNTPVDAALYYNRIYEELSVR